MSEQHGMDSDVGVVDRVDTDVEAFVGKHGRYRLVRPLGQGGMGETLLVRSEADGAELVLKRLRLETAEDWKVVELFQREATVLESLDHPGIPAYVDHLADSDGTTVGIVQSFAPGVPMGVFVGDRSIDSQAIERTLRQVLHILVYLHQRSPPVIHRDITPNNIMLSDGQAMLIDFGAVKASLRTSTQVTSVGTFGYMPPEQLMGHATPASDLYALGMSLAAIATGCAPETFPLDPETGRSDVKTGLLGSGLPVHVQRTLEAMTRPGLGGRCKSAKEALQLLDAPPEGSEGAKPLPKRPNSSRALPAMVAGIVLLGAVAAMFALRGTPSSDEHRGQPGVIVASTTPPPAPVEPLAPTLPSARPVEPVVQPAPQPTPRSIATQLTEDNSASLTLRSQPPGATVKEGDKVLCVTPCQMRMPFGERKLRFELGDKTQHERVMVIRDAQISVAF